MQLTCPDCHVECTIDEQSVETVTCPACGVLLYSKSGRSGSLAAQLAILAGQPAEVSEVDLEKTRQWQRSVDDVLPVPELFPQRLGRYELRKKLGEGSFAEVYLAFDSDLSRDVALKIPRRNRFSSAEQLRRFLDEARTSAILEHPGIVRVYDIGWISEEVCFISMEYCAGGSLSELIKAELLTCDRAMEMVESLADAIHFAHLHGFVHRDLKPSNVMIGRDGRPRIVDFGLALSDKEQLKHAGEIAGTLPYMSPEQVRGETHHLDGRTDIWSLGVILYQLLVGRRPFSGSRELVVDQIRNREAKPLRQIKDDVPADLEEICLRCLQKSPAARYSTAKDFAQDLRAFRERQTASASKVIPVATLPSRRNSKSQLIYLGLTMLILLGCLGGLWAVVGPKRPVDSSELDWSVDKQPLGAAFDLLKRSPRKLAWPTDETPTANFTYDTKIGSLNVSSPGFTLLELGETEASEFELEADICLTTASGDAGFFWGFGWHADAADKHGQLQAAFIRSRPDDADLPSMMQLQHIRLQPHSKYGLFATDFEPEGSQNIKREFGRAHRLSVHLRDNQLVSFAWDHQLMNEILNQHQFERKSGFRPLFRVQGSFGILANGASITARNVRFTPITYPRKG